MTLQLTGGEAIIRALRPEGVKNAYGIVGGKLAPLFKALAEENALRFYGTRHEANGAYMAAAHFARTGEMALVLTELGPGTTNVVPAVASAFNNRLALLLVTSNNHHAASYPNRGMFMEADLAALLQPVTKWNAVVHDARRIPELVREAFRQALTGRPGPVHLDVPQEILHDTFEFADDAFSWSPDQYRLTVGAPAAAGLDQAAALLLKAERPLLIAGGGLARSGRWDGFRVLRRELGAAAVATQMGIGAVATDDPAFIGHGGVIGGPAMLRALREADVVLALGCRFSSWMWDVEGPLVRAPQKLLQVDSDPAALGAAAPLAVGLLGDAGAAADALAKLVAGAAQRDGAWLGSLRAEYLAYREKLAGLATAPADEAMHPALLAEQIAACVPAEALVTLDGGHTSFWSNDVTAVLEPRRVFHEPGLAQLGFGLPYAVALALQEPGATVVNIVGDGAFGFTLQELDTARRYGARVINFVHNNAAWGVIGSAQKRLNFSLAVGLEGTDYAAIARGFGCFGEIVETPDQVAPAFARAVASGLPAVIDCRTRFVSHPMMPAFGAMGAYGYRK